MSTDCSMTSDLTEETNCSENLQSLVESQEYETQFFSFTPKSVADTCMYRYS